MELLLELWTVRFSTDLHNSLIHLQTLIGFFMNQELYREQNRESDANVMMWSYGSFCVFLLCIPTFCFSFLNLEVSLYRRTRMKILVENKRERNEYNMIRAQEVHQEKNRQEKHLAIYHILISNL